MSQPLASFMEKLTREVTEGMQVARRVRLMSEGTVFESWEPVQGIAPEEWARDAETLVQALLPELPKRRVQLTFVAEDSAGATVATLLRTVTGQNPSAQDLGTQNGAKALADALAAIGKTMDATLETARKVMEFQSSQIDKLHTQLGEAHELFMAIRKAELENTEQESAASKILMEQVQNAAPLMMELLGHWATKTIQEGAKKTATAAIAGAGTGAAPPNGAGVQAS